MGHVFDIQRHDRVGGQRGIQRDEIARTVETGTMVSGTRNKHQCARGLILRFREMTCQGDLHGDAVSVVTGAIKPGVDVGVDDDHLFTVSARDHRDAVGRAQIRERLCFQRQFRLHDVKRTGFGSLVQRGFQKGAIAAADIEAGTTAVVEVLRHLVARLVHDVDDGDGAALEHVLRARHDSIPLKHHMGLWRHLLHGDLATHIDVRQFCGTAFADIDQRSVQATIGQL